jgi:hypothetical protein
VTPYFDMSITEYVSQANITQDGYVTQGYHYKQSICIGEDAVSGECSIGNEDFFVGDILQFNNWNYESQSHAGIIGLGRTSPVWNFVNVEGDLDNYVTVEFSNVTDWTFANSSYTNSTYGNKLTLGKTSDSTYDAATKIAFGPTVIGGFLYSLENFGFGIYNDTTKEAFYHSIMNTDETLYGIQTNTTKITMDFRGLGLPTTSYAAFTNLIDIISSGQVHCAKTQGGFCVLPESCDNYPNLWEYSFQIKFLKDDPYLVVPLASFASDQTTRGTDVCYIYVEELDESLDDSRSIVLGQMFFQSVVMFNQVRGAAVLDTSVQIAVNVNALYGTYITDGSGVTTMTTSPFEIVMETVTLDDASSERGLPTVLATMNGFSALKATFFYLDF